MRFTRNTLILGLVLVLLMAVGVTAVSAAYPVSAEGVSPIFMNDGPGGNVTCSQVGSYQFESERYDDGDQFAGSYMTINWSTLDNTYVSWSGMHGGLAVIVKGGPGAHVYVYDASYTSDSLLAAPPAGPGPAELSNITFCYNPPPNDCDWIGETAWSAGSRYTQRGNWATYTPYTGVAKSVTLFAGQHKNAGSVHFSAPAAGKVTITITLNPGWRFEAVPQNVKVQGYANAPSGNPAPGLFAHKATAAGSPFHIVVPQAGFYGVHANVEWEKCR